jgi:hypothetical protein
MFTYVDKISLAFHNSAFVEMIFNLVIKNDLSTKDFDARNIDVAQIQPMIAKSKGFNKEKFVEIIDLTKVFWLVAFILFCVERAFSLNYKKEMHG